MARKTMAKAGKFALTFNLLAMVEVLMDLRM
jgi:hypothetical protein